MSHLTTLDCSLSGRAICNPVRKMFVEDDDDSASLGFCVIHAVGRRILDILAVLGRIFEDRTPEFALRRWLS